MKDNTKSVSMISVCGFVGIVGIIFTIISDLILVGRPTDAYSYFIVGTETLAGLPEWRITIGTFVGVIAIPFQTGGLVTLYNALKPAGKVKALTVVLPLAHGLIMAVAFHISYAFIGSGWNLYYNTAHKDIAISQLLNKFSFYWWFVLLIIAADVIISSILYTFLVIKKKTLYPGWMALLNPICILLVVFIIILTLPAPIGGYIAPTFLNLSTLIFFTISMLAPKNNK